MCKKYSFSTLSMVCFERFNFLSINALRCPSLVLPRNPVYHPCRGKCSLCNGFTLAIDMAVARYGVEHCNDQSKTIKKTFPTTTSKATIRQHIVFKLIFCISLCAKGSSRLAFIHDKSTRQLPKSCLRG